MNKAKTPIKIYGYILSLVAAYYNIPILYKLFRFKFEKENLKFNNENLFYINKYTEEYK